VVSRRSSAATAGASATAEADSSGAAGKTSGAGPRFTARTAHPDRFDPNGTAHLWQFA
jgi:hypothetical protein